MRIEIDEILRKILTLSNELIDRIITALIESNQIGYDSLGISLVEVRIELLFSISTQL